MAVSTWQSLSFFVAQSRELAQQKEWDGPCNSRHDHVAVLAVTVYDAHKRPPIFKVRHREAVLVGAVGAVRSLVPLLAEGVDQLLAGGVPEALASPKICEVLSLRHVTMKVSSDLHGERCKVISIHH